MHARISMHRLASDGLAPLEPHIHTIDAVTTVPELMAAYVPPNSEIPRALRPAVGDCV
jgi:hypothetical protein